VDRAEEFVSPPPEVPVQEEIPAQEEYEEQAQTPAIPRQVYAAVLDYLLKVEIPPQYQKEFDRYKPLLTQVLALANIRREDIPRYLDYFDVISYWYKIGEPEIARKRMARMVTELLLTRSVDGFQQRILGTTRVERAFEPLPREKRKEKRGFWIFRR